MVETKKLEVINADGTRLSADLIIADDSLRLVFPNFDSGIVSGDDELFFCLQKLHSILDEKNIRLLCNGCRYDVRPSGMSLSMGGGLRAYVMVLGRKAAMVDLVDIFDATDQVDKIQTVEAQNSFYVDWLTSIRH